MIINKTYYFSTSNDFGKLVIFKCILLIKIQTKRKYRIVNWLKESNIGIINGLKSLRKKMFIVHTIVFCIQET